MVTLFNSMGKKSRGRRNSKRKCTLQVEQMEGRVVPSTTPYLLPTVPGATITPIISVGDAVPQPDGATGGVAGPYRMAGIPDGLGAYDNGDGTFTVLMNHEIVNPNGVTRDHGSKGAFVSKWVIDKATLNVISGDDLIKTMQLWDPTANGGAGGYVSGTTALSRLCSADLPAASAFFNAASGLGTTERIFMDGEEIGGGRAFGHVVTGAYAGTSFELPLLGKFAHENTLANPLAQNFTIVAGLDDTTPVVTPTNNGGGKVYLYIGTKTAAGTPVERAGLTNGTNYAIQVDSLVVESRDFGLATAGPGVTTSGTFTPVNSATGGTQFQRPEDGAWDPSNPSDFYFVTTDRYDQVKDGVGAQVGRSRLWRLHFTDIANPSAGGTIQMIVDGTGPGNMFDNLTIDRAGYIILQEDVGNQAHNGKIFRYDITDGSLTQIVQHNPALFGDIGVPATAPFNQDEESSGVIDVSSIFGEGTFLLDVQAHYLIDSGAGHNLQGFSNPDELVEGGQLLLLRTKIVTASLVDSTLDVQGTPYADVIEVSQSGKNLIVTANGKQVAQFAKKDVSLIQVDGAARNDIIAVAENVKIDAILRGGKGNDIIFGGGGSDIILGEDGNDVLFGRGKADLLIGGKGSDFLFGGTGGDLLIAGYTAYDANDAALVQILTEWTSAHSYNQRVNNLRNGLGGVPKLDASTVFDDAAVDVLFGGTGRDWFLGNAGADWIFNNPFNEQVN